MASDSSLSAAFASSKRLLKNRNVAWLWTGQAISQIGDGLSKVALLWFVYDLTGSALKMTLIGILQTIPPLVFGPFAGVVLDRVSKRWAMIIIDTVRAGLLVVIPTLYWMGLLTLPWLYVLVFLTATFSMAFGPALKAMEPLLVKSDQLTQINALDQSTMTLGQLLGPAISGLLIAVIGAQNVLYVNAGTFLVSALCKIPLKVKEPRRSSHASAPMKGALRELKEGIRFVVVDHRLLLLLMGVASLFTVGSTAFVYLLPVLAKDYLHVNAVQLGWLWASLSVGLLVVTLWMMGASQRELCKRLLMIAGAAAVGGAAVFGLTVMTSFFVVAALIAAVGASSGVVNPFVSASLQERAPKDMLARVFSVFNTGTLVASMVGMTACGWIADRFGPVASLFAIAAVNGAAAVLTAVVIPWCRRLRAQEEKPNNKRRVQRKAA
jgi:DHA3 family macrolide efflux protein-like MFS transporter